MKYMSNSLVVETKSGTTFSVRADGKTELLRTDQPACEIPTADLLEAAKAIEASNS